MKHEPVWTETPLPRFPPLQQDLSVDVAVVGGGVAGITAAYLLKQAGAKVALLERGHCASADTGHTTAHLTFVTDLRLHELVRRFGEDGGRALWDAGAAAIEQIRDIVEREAIDCEFEWVPGYLHASLHEGDDGKERESLMRDAQLARDLGFGAAFLDAVPFCGKPGVRFASQAKFHPRKYLAALLRAIPGGGSHVYEDSAVTEFEDQPLAVKAGEHRVRCAFVVVATHTPLVGNRGTLGALLFQTKLALYTSYVLGARIRPGSVPEALYWDTTDPYYYLRIDRGEERDFAIFGGEDVKTGQEDDPEIVFHRLEQEMRRWLPDAEVTHRWLGQVIETNDGLPFIGEAAENQFVATGLCGNGFTFGTLAAMMARDRFGERTNPWEDLLDVHRKKLRGGTWRYVTENLDYPYHLLRDRLARADTRSLDDVPRGAGRIVRVDGRKVAAYRDEQGALTLLSPVCTHLGCIVRWNGADHTWDCPCHGSRFKPDGEVLSGPAESPLGKSERS